MGGRFTKCGDCGTTMGSDTPIFRIYHTSKFGGKYMCRDCLMPKIKLVKDDSSYTVKFFDQILTFPIISSNPELRESC